MLKSLFKFFNEPDAESIIQENDDKIILFGGIMVEAATIDGKIDNNEIGRIKKSLIEVFKISQTKTDSIVAKCLEKANEPNSLYYFSSKINKVFKYDKKIALVEILWEIILADGKIHDFESNLMRRLSGLLYISDIECGNAKKRILEKINERN